MKYLLFIILPIVLIACSKTEEPTFNCYSCTHETSRIEVCNNEALLYMEDQYISTNKVGNIEKYVAILESTEYLCIKK